jgi:biopolymer transport protein ExbD
LVLLVIVLATASFVTNKSIKVDLPTANTTMTEDRKNITIAIDAEGKYFFNKENLSLEEIKKRLEKLDIKKDLISLRTDRKADFEYFVDVIDYMKERGFENISIVTK